MLASLSIFSFVPFVREKNFFLSLIYFQRYEEFFFITLCVYLTRFFFFVFLIFIIFFFCGRVDDESNAAVNGGRNSIEIHHVEFFYNTQYKYFLLLRLQNVLIR